MKQGYTFIQGNTFLYSEFFKCKSCTWENRNISLPVFHKRKSCYLKKKTTPVWRMHWLIKSGVRRKQLESLLSPWSFTVRLLGCITHLCLEEGPQAGPHQAWDHHLPDHMNQDYSRYPAREEKWDTAGSTTFHLPHGHKKLCYIFTVHESNVTTSLLSVVKTSLIWDHLYKQGSSHLC